MTKTKAGAHSTVYSHSVDKNKFVLLILEPIIPFPPFIMIIMDVYIAQYRVICSAFPITILYVHFACAHVCDKQFTLRYWKGAIGITRETGQHVLIPRIIILMSSPSNQSINQSVYSLLKYIGRQSSENIANTERYRN